MLELKIGRLLELHEYLVIEKGHFERAQRALHNKSISTYYLEIHHFKRLRESVSEFADITSVAKLDSTAIAANRTKQWLAQAGDLPSDAKGTSWTEEQCGNGFRHLADICSRIRDDCGSRIYYQIAAQNDELLKEKYAHFGPEVEVAFNQAAEDISEAAKCLALERTTACVFHLMRAMELVLHALSGKIGATIKDEHGRLLPWGVIVGNVGAKVNAMPHGSEKDEWSNAHALLYRVNQAWRTPTMHPKQTYTETQAREVFDSTKAFMRSLATLV